MRYSVNGKATALLILATLALSPAALADRARRPEARRMQALAFELEVAAADLTASARGGRRHLTRAERRALKDIQAFEASARRYHRRVDRSDGDARVTWGAFQRTVRSYDRALLALDRMRPLRRARMNLGQVDRIIDRLSRFYGRPGHDRYSWSRPGSERIRGH